MVVVLVGLVLTEGSAADCTGVSLLSSLRIVFLQRLLVGVHEPLRFGSVFRAQFRRFYFRRHLVHSSIMGGFRKHIFAKAVEPDHDNVSPFVHSVLLDEWAEFLAVAHVVDQTHLDELKYLVELEIDFVTPLVAHCPGGHTVDFDPAVGEAFQDAHLKLG
jgi:hypothetical protein